MSQYIEYLKQVELALAAYAKNLTPESAPELIKLEDAGFSTFQANKFIDKYNVVDQHSDSTGLSATVFKSTDSNNPQTFLAIRGTEVTDPGDMLTNLVNIALFGDTTLHPQYISLKSKVQEWLDTGKLPQNFTVTGHSLGGFLATDLAADAQFANHITHAYLYNTPGQADLFGDLINMLQNTRGIPAQYESTKYRNIEAIVNNGIKNSSVVSLDYDASSSNHGHENDKTTWKIFKPVLLCVACLMMTFGLFFSSAVKAETAADESAMEQSAETRPVPYDFCGTRPWQKETCGHGQTGKGYTVCEAYLKYLNQSLSDLNVCQVAVPPKFKVPDWEAMDIHANLHLAYKAEQFRFYRYKSMRNPGFELNPGFEVWKKQFLEDMETGQITPRMKKARITPTDKGDVTILAYSRDSERCQKGLAGLVPKGKSRNNQWTGSGNIHFILSENNDLQEIEGYYPLLSRYLYEMLLYNDRPYFIETPRFSVAETPTEISPRYLSIYAVSNKSAKLDQSPNFIPVYKLCNFVTIYDPFAEEQLEIWRKRESKANNPEGEKP